MLVCTAVLDPCHYSNEILEVSIAVGAGCQISLNTLKKKKKKTSTHKDGAHIHADSHLVCTPESVQVSSLFFPFSYGPLQTPLHPHRTCKPEYFTNTPITRSLPATTLIQYDSFILAIFSICPLRFFPLPTDGGNFSVTFSVCTVVKVPNCMHTLSTLRGMEVRWISN